MFKIVRKKGIVKTIVSIIAISFIASAFIVWGSRARFTGKEISNIGIIFNKKISPRQFYNSYKARYILLRLSLGEDFHKYKDTLNLNAQAWQRLIILEAAKREKIEVTNTELIDYIEGFPLFQTKDGFSLQLYELITKNLRITKREFEEIIREQLIIEKFYNNITKDVDITEEEILETYKIIKETVSLEILSILPVDFIENIEINIEGARNYYSEHLDDFKEPDKVNIQYIGQSYVPEMNEEEKNKIKSALSAVYKKLKKTTDITKTAEEYSFGVKETGFFAANEPIPELGWLPQFTNQAFFLNPEEMSAPLDTPHGCYILKLKEAKSSYIPDFEIVKDKVINVLKQQNARVAAQEEAEKQRNQIQEKLDKNPELSLEKLAENLKLKYTKKQDFKRSDYLPGLGFSKQAQEFAFNLSEEGISQVIESQVGFYLLRKGEFKGINQEKFLEEKDILSKQILQQKKESEFAKFSKEELEPNTSLLIDISKDENLLY